MIVSNTLNLIHYILLGALSGGTTKDVDKYRTLTIDESIRTLYRKFVKSF